MKKIWVVEGKVSGENWTPVFNFPRTHPNSVIYSYYKNIAQATKAALFMQENNNSNLNNEQLIVLYRAAQYQRIYP